MSEKKNPYFKVVRGNKKEDPEKNDQTTDQTTTVVTPKDTKPVFKENITDEEISRVLAEGADKNRRGKLVMIVGIIIAVLSFVMTSPLNVIMLFGGVVVAAFGYAMKHSARHDVKMEAGIHIVQGAMHEVFDEFDYQPEKGIDINLVGSTDMGFPFSFNEVDSDDSITAVYHGLNVRLADVKLVQVTTSTDDDGEQHENRETVFQGLWMTCDFGKELTADMILAEGRRFRKNGVKTDNERFNKKFGILASNPQDVFYILTPHMMEYIMEMDSKGEGDTYMNFSRSGQLSIAINTGHPAFEIDSFDMTADEMRKKFVGEVRYITDLIDELRLVDTMYKN